MRKILSFFLVTAMMLTFCVFSVGAENTELTTVRSWNLTLADEIAANFYVDIADGVASDAQMKVTDGYGTWFYPVAEAEQDKNGSYIFTARVAAAQMTETISLQLICGEQEGSVHTYCAADYGRYIMEKDYDASTKALVKAMLNYGANAQLYFGYRTDDLANAGYEAEATADMPATTDVAIDGELDGVAVYGATLVLRSKVATRFYFTVAGDIANYTFSTADGINYTPVAHDGLYYVEVPDILPQNYDKMITITVADNENVTLQVSYSPMCYISRKYAQSENETLRNLMVAMYQYHTEAVAYVQEYSIAYAGLEGTSHNNPATYTAATAGQIVLQSPSARTGYQFDGWYVGDTLVTSLAGMTGDLTLTAKWTRVNYDIELPESPI